MTAESTLRRKMVVVGDYGSGKTAFLQHLITGEFQVSLVPLYLSLKGINYRKELFRACAYENYVIELRIEGRLLQLALWDTATQEEYDRLRPLSYPNTAVMVIAFAIDSRESFENASERWHPEILHFCSMPKPPILLLGCKSDLRRQNGVPPDQGGLRDVTEEEGRALANRIGAVGYSECSAKTGEGINEALEIAAKAAISWDPLVKLERQRKCLVM